MLVRQLESVLRSRLRDYPAVALVGPRQCGKTTLAKQLAARLFDLEQEPDRLALDLEWAAVAADRGLTVLDEAQSWPAIFPRLRQTIDADRGRKGRFLLLGSVSPELMTKVSESLAGRLSIVELSPLSLAELGTAGITDNDARDRLWLCGGFPEGGVLAAHRYPRWQLDYLRLLTARDLPNWGLAARPEQTERFTKMLAALHGQPWNASQLGQSLGVSYHTVNHYLDFLEGAFLCRRLLPWHGNIGKRLVKKPKVYWRDSGLLHALLGVTGMQDLLTRPWVGASWEGFVIEQIITALTHRETPSSAFFLRTSDQREIDLLIEFGSRRWAFEIKLSSQPTPHDMDRLVANAALVDAEKCFLVSQSNEVVDAGKRVACDLPWLIGRLEKTPL
jgi:predicted AAA+ superfamily ATPase